MQIGWKTASQSLAILQRPAQVGRADHREVVKTEFSGLPHEFGIVVVLIHLDPLVVTARLRRPEGAWLAIEVLSDSTWQWRNCGQAAVHPPSTNSTVPVTKLASSLAR